MALTCFIRYQIDPFQREAFRAYAEHWGRIIPRCGGDLIGYFLPHEGSNDIAWGLIGFADLAAYERYRARLRSDPEGRANFELAQQQRFILREERSWLEDVTGTRGPAATDAGYAGHAAQTAPTTQTAQTAQTPAAAAAADAADAATSAPAPEAAA